MSIDLVKIFSEISEERVNELLEEISVKGDELRAHYKRVYDHLKEVEVALNAATPGVVAWTKDKRFGYGKLPEVPRPPEAKKEQKEKGWGLMVRTAKGACVSVWESGVRDRIELALRLEELLQLVWTEMGAKVLRSRLATSEMGMLMEGVRWAKRKQQNRRTPEDSTTPE